MESLVEVDVLSRRRCTRFLWSATPGPAIAVSVSHPGVADKTDGSDENRETSRLTVHSSTVRHQRSDSGKESGMMEGEQCPNWSTFLLHRPATCQDEKRSHGVDKQQPQPTDRPGRSSVLAGVQGLFGSFGWLSRTDDGRDSEIGVDLFTSGSRAAAGRKGSHTLGPCAIGQLTAWKLPVTDLLWPRTS
jgi:hypothetical protein